VISRNYIEQEDSLIYHFCPVGSTGCADFGGRELHRLEAMENCGVPDGLGLRQELPERTFNL
jgi:hypothetical protein